MTINNSTILKNIDWQQFNARLLWIYENHVAPNSSHQEMRVTEFHSLWLVKEGEVDMNFSDNSSYHATTGSWVVTTPGMKKTQQFSENAHILSIAFSAGWPGSKNLFQLEAPIIFSANNNIELNQRAKKLLDYISQNVTPEYTQQQSTSFEFSVYTKIQFHFWTFLYEWYNVMIHNQCTPQLKSDIDPRLKPALPILQQHHFNHPLPYNRLCRNTGLSRSHFDRRFKQEFKTSPKKFCEQICLENATHQLTSKTLSVKEIAYDLGFVNTSHFCTWFKRKKHQTPEEYRHSFV
jgi:AraC-like DNA-binding protein